MNGTAVARLDSLDNALAPIGSAPVRFALMDDVAIGQLPRPSWLIDGILPGESFAVLFGMPESAKSFLALDWAFCVGTGQPWNGFEVEQGEVVYVASEGASGYPGRVEAWKASHDWVGKAGVYFVTDPLDLGRLDDAKLFVERLKEQDVQPKLIVIDTLARCFRGDDNSAREMGMLVAAVDFIRRSFKCAVMLVHHSTKDDSSFRGSGALHGAADTMIHARLDENKTTATVTSFRTKDARGFERLTFRLVSVGESAILRLTSETAIHHPADKPLSRVTQLALESLDAVDPMTFTAWSEAFVSAGGAVGSFPRSAAELVRRDLVTKLDDGMYRRVELGDDAG